MNDTSHTDINCPNELHGRATNQASKKLAVDNRGCRPSRQKYPLKTDWSTRLYVNAKDCCLFCGETHCIEELKLRPLFWEMGAFVGYGEFNQDFLIQNAELQIDFEKGVVSYILAPDIILSTYTFDGENIFYFGDGPNLPASHGKWHNMTAEALGVLNTIKEGWPFPNLEGHRVEVVGRNG